MIAQIPPISSVTQGSVNSASQISSSTGTAAPNQAFLNLLMTQMANPNLDSLFGNTENTGNSTFGTNDISSLLGTSSSSNPLSNLTGLSSQPQIEMSIWSNLIGKTVKILVPETQQFVNGKVESITLQNGAPILVLDNGTAVSPDNLVEIK